MREDAGQRSTTGSTHEGVPRRRVLKGSAAAAVGITTTLLPTAAQAFSLTSAGVPVSGVTVYWSERASGSNGRIGRLVYRGLGGGIDTIENDWLTGLTDPRALVADAGHIYYAVPFAGGNTSLQGIWRANIADRTTTRVVAASNILGFTIEGADLYYARNGDGIYRTAKDGSGSATQLVAATPQHGGVAVLGDDLILTDMDSGLIRSVPKVGGSLSTLATLANCQTLAVAGSTIFVTATTGRVHRFRADGTADGQFFVTGTGVGIQTLDSTVFVATSNSTYLQAMGPDGGNRDLFATTGQTPTTIVNNAIDGIAVVG